MISAANWWAGLSNYNSVLFPFQLIVMAVAALLTIYMIVKPGHGSSTAMKGFLCFSMLFNGIVFFIILGGHLPAPLKYVQSGLFIAAGVLFFIDIIRNRSMLRIPLKEKHSAAALLLLIVVALYPILGLLRGHNVTQLIYPGTLPCGSTAFALVILAASLPCAGKPVCLLLLIWAIPFAPLIQIPVFKVYEDAIMVLTGIYTLIRLISTYRIQMKEKEGERISNGRPEQI